MGKLWYEECRHKRMAENRNRMEALHLPQISQVLRTPSFKTFPSPKKPAKSCTVEKAVVVVRRSGQVGLQTNLPPVYKAVSCRAPANTQEGLAILFCKMNLPKHDDVITLIDEEGDEYPTLYLARKTGLSGGWKGFAFAHE